MPHPSTCTAHPTLTLRIAAFESEPSDFSSSDTIPFVLVAAHAQPGPGPTGTQEERLQSASPALSLSALLTPAIPDDAAVVTSAFPVHAAWTGHNRTAVLRQLYLVSERPRRHYLLADALPLDQLTADGNVGLLDLRPGRVEREVRKLFAAFSGAASVAKREEYGGCIVEAGAWGCGAFGGNVLVKGVCMAVAAGLAGVEVVLTLLEGREEVSALQMVLGRGLRVAELWSSLRQWEANPEFGLLHGRGLSSD
ncbi:hypothetical protein H2201_006270 [Coniosporium apollinis]|uniref:PARG catalytic Macro domain-containing protein n=1 Tax=Coniosporium apollinis TaxID=61459 RepID=A0ABQ9NP15_9PEZI|nr:hypothetical protein H2201_006270 [Coniosporium apollinis]